MKSQITLFGCVKAIQIKNLMHASSNRYKEESLRLEGSLTRSFDCWKVNNLNTNHSFIYKNVTPVPQTPGLKPPLEFGGSKERTEKERDILKTDSKRMSLFK